MTEAIYAPSAYDSRKEYPPDPSREIYSPGTFKGGALRKEKISYVGLSKKKSPVLISSDHIHLLHSRLIQRFGVPFHRFFFANDLTESMLTPSGCMGVMFAFWAIIAVSMGSLALMTEPKGSGDAIWIVLGPVCAFFTYRIYRSIAFDIPLVYNSIYEEIRFDRFTGNVIFPAKDGGIEDAIPFHEFDGYRVYLGEDVELYVGHRYSAKGIHFPSKEIMSSKEFFQWQYLCDFMDISKPLPDTILTEPFRHLDPTTKLYDQRYKRPADLWFKKDKNEILKIIDAAEAVLVWN